MKTYVGTITPSQMDWAVTVDGNPLAPRLDLRNHSPTGFAWGYSGSGPSQLALAILANCCGKQFALMHYQDFKFAVIAGLPQDKPFTMTSDFVEQWANGRAKAAMEARA